MTMNTQLTLDQLRSMNLYGMANAYEASLCFQFMNNQQPIRCLGNWLMQNSSFEKNKARNTSAAKQNPLSGNIGTSTLQRCTKPEPRPACQSCGLPFYRTRGKYPDYRGHRLRQELPCLCPRTTGLFSGIPNHVFQCDPFS